MLKLDPDDNDSEEEGLEKTKVNNTSNSSNPVLNSSTPNSTNSSFLNSTGVCLSQSFNESGTSNLNRNIPSTPNHGNKLSNNNAFNSSTNPVMS